MRRKRTHIDYLQDMLDNSEKAQRFLNGVTREAFAASDEKVYAVVHALQTVGEAARHIPKSMRQRYRSIEWDDIVGMRDIVVHDYFGVDVEIVWRTVQEDLPPLANTVKKMLSDLSEEDKPE
jgi:uncharacterized protein with HEPN domain